MTPGDPNFVYPEPPPFDAWVEYCFTDGYADFVKYTEEAEDRVNRFTVIEPDVLAKHLTRLFESPEFIEQRFDRNQIASGIQFVFGIASGYFECVADAAPHLRTQCYASIEWFYRLLLDRICDQGDDLDSIVYMIWDMDCVEGPMYRDPLTAEAEQCFLVLEGILATCQTAASLRSALHGLGHVVRYHRERCEQIIDQFLATREIPDLLRAYALEARSGTVM